MRLFVSTKLSPQPDDHHAGWQKTGRNFTGFFDLERRYKSLMFSWIYSNQSTVAMKNTILFLLQWAPILLFAQNEQILFDRVRIHGGFGAPIAELTSVNNQAGMFGGGGGAIIVNDFFIGGFGQGGNFADHVGSDGRNYNIDFNYGGLWLGYVKPTVKVVHFYSSLKVAGGKVNVTLNADETGLSQFSESMYVIQPELGVEFNLFRWFRIALTGSYRAVGGIQSDKLDGMTNNEFNAPSMALTFRFGKFYRPLVK